MGVRVSVGLGDETHDYLVMRAAALVKREDRVLKNRTLMFSLHGMEEFVQFMQLLPDEVLAGMRWVNADARP